MWPFEHIKITVLVKHFWNIFYIQHKTVAQILILEKKTDQKNKKDKEYCFDYKAVEVVWGKL